MNNHDEKNPKDKQDTPPVLPPPAPMPPPPWATQNFPPPSTWQIFHQQFYHLYALVEPVLRCVVMIELIRWLARN